MLDVGIDIDVLTSEPTYGTNTAYREAAGGYAFPSKTEVNGTFHVTPLNVL